MKALEIVEGDSIFVAGFPMGLVARPRARPLLRSGCIARVQDLYEDGGREFLVDAEIFPGNSGGPVFLAPQQLSVTGAPPVQEGGLIGIVYSYVPYQEIAVSQQTGQPRVIFQENSGLSAVLTVDCIDETIETLETRYPVND
jgi:hypothetical protein